MFLQNSISYRKLGFELGLAREVSRLCLIKMPKNFEKHLFFTIFQSRLIVRYWKIQESYCIRLFMSFGHKLITLVLHYN